MTRATYTDEQRQQALAIYAEHGPGAAARETGIPKGTIASWARRNQVQTSAPQKGQVQAAALTIEARKQALASRLLEEADRMLNQLHAPTVEKKVVPAGEDPPRIVTVDREVPTFGDQRHITWCAAVMVDKVVKLTGGDRLSVSLSGEPDRDVEAVASEVVSLAEARWRREDRDVG